MPAASQIPFAKLLLLSSCAAAAVGPQQRMPAAARASANPAASGASGPGNTRSIDWSTAKLTNGRHVQLTSMATFSAMVAVPGFPGATKSFVSKGLAEKRPGESVLASARADQQNPHVLTRPSFAKGHGVA